MAVQAASLLDSAIRKTMWVRFALGAGLSLAGVGLIELFLLFEMHPLSPIGLPGMLMLIAAALGGTAGFVGGVLVVEAYYLVNFSYHYRFPEFYATPYNTLLWTLALAVMGFAILAVRPRLLRGASAEAELAARRLYEQALRESEERLRIITDNVPALVSYIDAEQRYRFANRAHEDWLGVARGDMLGRRLRDVWGEKRYARHQEKFERALRGERVTYDYAFTQGVVERHVLATYVPDVAADGRVKGFFVLAGDITALAAARNELRAEHARLEAALDGSNVALWDTDLRTGRVYLSDSWASIVGAPPGEMVTTLDELIAIVHPDDIETAKRTSLEVMKGLRSTYAIEHRVRSRAGDWKWIISRGRVTERDPVTGRALRMIGTNVDITDRRRMEDAVQSVARSDPLTGLANRLLFNERLRVAAARCRRTGGQIALLYLDLDRFKEVNDGLGHAAGDVLLRDFAERLRASVRSRDTVARFGGDEFVVLLEELKEPDNAVRVAEKIVAESRRPLSIEGREVVATASIGLAYGDGTEEDALLKRADAALYEAKAAGRDRYCLAKN